MRTPTDALRSLKRYVALALPEFESAIVTDEGRFKRPFVHVQAADNANYPNGTTSRFLTEVIQPYVIHAYSPKGPEEEDGLLSALEIEERLYQAFKVGIDGEGFSMRVPLYDYDGVGRYDGTGERFFADYMRVTDLSIGHISDPNDRALLTVAVDIRLSWMRTAGTLPGGPLVDAVNLTGP